MHSYLLLYFHWTRASGCRDRNLTFYFQPLSGVVGIHSLTFWNPFIAAVLCGWAEGVSVFVFTLEKRVCVCACVCSPDKGAISQQPLWSLSLPGCRLKAGACSWLPGPGPAPRVAHLALNSRPVRRPRSTTSWKGSCFSCRVWVSVHFHVFVWGLNVVTRIKKLWKSMKMRLWFRTRSQL